MTLDEAIKHAEEVAKQNEEDAVIYSNCKNHKKNLYEIGLAENAEKKCCKCAEEHRQLAEWLKELKRLRERTKWISCKERLPEEHEWIGTKKFGTTISNEVYVTFETPDGERFAKHISFQNGKLSSVDKQHMKVWYKGAKPIAWMPLPEALKEEKHEAE